MSSGWADWACIYTDGWQRQFAFIVRKRIPHNPELAAEAMEEVRQELAIKLSALDEAPLAPDAYIRTAFRHALEDYLRSRDGYPRPPEWIRRLGGAYEQIYRLLCLERRPLAEIQAVLDSLYRYTRSFVERIAREVRAGVVNCGARRESVGLDTAAAEVDAVSAGSAGHQSPERILENLDAEAVITAVLGQAPRLDDAPATLVGALRALQGCAIDDDDRLMLRLVYVEGQSVSQAARVMKQPDAQARRRLKRTLQRIGQVLSDAGLALL